MFRVCVVGSGPGGMYAAKYLLKHPAVADKVRVDVLECLPTPYGLVRYGVAPDHPEVKSVTSDFDSVFGSPQVRYFGNVTVGKDVAVDSLLRNYDGVILAYGASKDRLLRLSDETNISNVWGARDFVNWYNGHPTASERPPPLLDCEDAAVVGQGNVALDIARILSTPVDVLAKTDISTDALEHLSQSKIKRVSVIGRRGSAQAACTIKELRELTKIGEDVGCTIFPDEFKLGLTAASMEEIGATRQKSRINTLMQKIVDNYEESHVKPKRVNLRFLLSPTRIHKDQDGRVSGLTLVRNALSGPSGNQSAVPVPESEPEEMPCGLLVRSIGYQSEALPGVPFREKQSIVLHEAGRVESVPGLYASGWVKRGPSGIIGTNITDARETVESVAEDLGKLSASKESLGQYQDLPLLLQPEKRSSIVSWESYQKIDEAEMRQGEESVPVKPRKKLLLVDEMLRVGLAK